MKIVQLNKNDLSGGAARAAYRLHDGLRRAGHESVMVVESRSGDDPSVLTFERPMDGVSLVRRGLRQMRLSRERDRYRSSRPTGYELFSDDRSIYTSTLLPQIPECQIINLHWISGFVDYRTFFGRSWSQRPIVWTLHDLNALTGGCHYNLGCDRYLTGCGTCPQLGSTNPNDLSRTTWARKQRLFSRLPSSKLHFVAPSKWLRSEVRSSPILEKFSVDVIPYGLDLEAFAPRERGSVRDLLGIPRDARVLLFLAEEISNRRKGFALLLDALARCARRVPNLLLVSLGQNKPQVSIETPWMHIGAVNNDRFLSMVYNAADLFAICALQDNLPNTVLEAIACGIPVVGHAVGGIPDMVRNGLNGLIVPVGDADALADAICKVLNNENLRVQMGANARRIATEEYPLDLQVRRYLELYGSLIEDQ
jgi:glycosyltransferase involved in cell wall biosynthesis